MKDNSSSLW